MKNHSKSKVLLASLALTVSAAISAQVTDGGTVTSSDQKTEITTVTRDGQADLIRFINSSNARANYQYLITDDEGNILAVENDSHDFEGASVGICRVYGISYEGNLTVQNKNASDAGLASGAFDVSDNWITVDRVLEITPPMVDVDGGQLSGGPFRFTLDGTPDMVSGITLRGNEGSNSTFVITDSDQKILGLPATLADLEAVDFDAAIPGICLIWHLSFEGELEGAEIDANAADLKGNFDLSNALSVTRLPETQPGDAVAGKVSGGPFEFMVGDGIPDMVSGIILEPGQGENTTWIITDNQRNILEIPKTLEDLEAINFDGSGEGVCLIWHLTYNGEVEGLKKGNNFSDFNGQLAASSAIRVTRTGDVIAPPVVVEGGRLSGGPFEFLVDGTPDMVSGITLQGNEGEKSTYVITDDKLNILGLPPTLEAVEGVDFDGAGAGVCLIWHLSYEGDLKGAEVGANAADLEGLFDLSNSLRVVRTGDVVTPPNPNPTTVEGGRLIGGPFRFTAGDNIPDMVSGITLRDNKGTNSSYVITDEKRTILGLPTTLADLETVDFNGAGTGVCLIWHLSYEDDLEGAEVDANAGDLTGTFDLSNPLRVVRTGDVVTPPNPNPTTVLGGRLIGGPFRFTAGDNIPDMVSGITLRDNKGTNSSYVITDEKRTILGLPTTLADLETVDFDGAGTGVCLIWHLSYEDDLEGAEVDANAGDLTGTFDLSNPLRVVRTGDVVTPPNPDPNPTPADVNGGRLIGGPFRFTAGDNIPDMVSGITLRDNKGTNSSYVITDEKRTILGLPTTLADLEAVDFDGAGTGVCLIWHLSYEDDLEGAAEGESAENLKGTFDLSNPLFVLRRGSRGGSGTTTPPTTVSLASGKLSGGPFNFVAGDGTPDFVSGISITGNKGSNSTWVITDEKRTILGLPKTIADLEAVDFDGAGTGVCLIWHMSYEGELQGLEKDGNLRNVKGNRAIAGIIRVNRTALGAKRSEKLDLDLKAFPNPANGIVNVSGTEDLKSGQITLISLTGRTLKTIDMASSQDRSFDLSDLKSGMYIINVLSLEKQQSFAITRK